MENFKYPFFGHIWNFGQFGKNKYLARVGTTGLKYEVAAIENKDHVFAAREDRKIENYGREMGQKIHLTFVLC